ncbi:MAG: helix-turn-helix domain-containing protein [Collinsella sp.]
MPVSVRLDKIMAERKISSNELAERIGTTPVNLSRIKKGLVAACASTHTSSYASPVVANPETVSKS